MKESDLRHTVPNRRGYHYNNTPKVCRENRTPVSGLQNPYSTIELYIPIAPTGFAPMSLDLFIYLPIFQSPTFLSAKLWG